MFQSPPSRLLVLKPVPTTNVQTSRSSHRSSLKIFPGRSRKWPPVLKRREAWKKKKHEMVIRCISLLLFYDLLCHFSMIFCGFVPCFFFLWRITYRCSMVSTKVFFCSMVLFYDFIRRITCVRMAFVASASE